ncbi:MAG: hypothetical protein HW389_724 [Bacteroidetes bacterium]|nr:hypothetical protein [Bacteroidota bacterium]
MTTTAMQFGKEIYKKICYDDLVVFASSYFCVRDDGLH